MKQPVDYKNKNSVIYKLRLKRFKIFESFLFKIKKIEQKEVLKILDVGGTLVYWETFNYTNKDNITILNIAVNEKSNYKKIKLVEGDATNLNQYHDGEFDIVFSNSVIEHVGDFSNQIKMRDEVLRVGKYSFIQTPNYFFPIEPHYRFPFFYLLPAPLKAYLLKTYHLRQRVKRKKPLSREDTITAVKTIQLLKKKDIKRLFPDNILIYEKYFGLTKSFISYTRI